MFLLMYTLYDRFFFPLFPYARLSNIKFPGCLIISFSFREIDNFQLKHRCIRFSPHNIFVSPWVIFVGKILNYKSLRLKEYMYFKMEAITWLFSLVC
jgi:hypothetical protein